MRGFTLLETAITSAILLIGLVAVAAMFSYSAGTNFTTQQRTTATVLLSQKMEQFKAASLTDTRWVPGGVLNAESPAAGYFDYTGIDSRGEVWTSTTDSTLPFIRVWQIAAAVPRTVTVSVHARRAVVSGRRMELIRATATAGSAF